jgi:5-methyltetrahydropteroyltriglutamate--homocysteine methyltransferase
MQGLLTTCVGSFSKPAYLATARSKHRAGRLSDDALERLTLQATSEILELQEEVGLDVLVHGEMERGDMVAYFAEHFEGMAVGGLVRSYGNRYYNKPNIVQELRWPGPVTVDIWRYAQAQTKRPVKGMLTGPYTLVEWSFDEYYADRRAAVLAMASVVRQEALALEAAGAVYIQIDEPACSTRTSDLALVLEANAIVTRDLRPETTTISHICYGDFLESYGALSRLPVMQLDLEMANSNYELLSVMAADPPDKDIGLGVLDVHSHRVETVDEITAGIERALRHFAPERLFIDPDCGFKTRTWTEAASKLGAMVEAVGRIREQHAGA